MILIKDEVPGSEVWKGGRSRNSRLFIDAVLYVAKTVCGWIQLPTEYGKWKVESGNLCGRDLIDRVKRS